MSNFRIFEFKDLGFLGFGYLGIRGSTRVRWFEDLGIQKFVILSIKNVEIREFRNRYSKFLIWKTHPRSAPSCANIFHRNLIKKLDLSIDTELRPRDNVISNNNDIITLSESNPRQYTGEVRKIPWCCIEFNARLSLWYSRRFTSHHFTTNSYYSTTNDTVV